MPKIKATIRQPCCSVYQVLWQSLPSFVLPTPLIFINSRSHTDSPGIVPSHPEELFELFKFFFHISPQISGLLPNFIFWRPTQVTLLSVVLISCSLPRKELHLEDIHQFLVAYAQTHSRTQWPLSPDCVCILSVARSRPVP